MANRYSDATRGVGALVLVGAMLASATPLVAGAAASIRLKDTDNQWVDPFSLLAGGNAVVFLFTSVDCPVSNRYAPVVIQLNQTFKSRGVQFWLVYPNPFDTPAAIRQHDKAFGYTMRALLDPDHTLATLAHATITPEAAVFDRNGREPYHGRIDDRFVSLGVERPAPTRHDLEDAISAILAGTPVAPQTTQAVGCFISDFVK